MALTSEYQYIGRTNSVKSNDGTYQYYVLLYAKTSGSMSTGKHTVSIKTRMACTGASSFYDWPTKGYIKANGKTVKEWDMQPYPSKAWNTTAITEGGVKYLQWVDMMEVSTTVDTGYGVDKDIAIETSWTMQGGNGAAYLPKPNSPCTASVSVTLSMIAGASTITSVSSVTIGKSCSVKWTPLSSSFGYKLKFSCGSWNYTTGAITPKTTSAYTYTGYTIPMDVANQITSASSGSMKVELFSYTDSTCKTQIGSSSAKTVTATVPDNSSTKPSVSMDLSVVSDLGSAFSGLYIQNLTKVKATISASGKYGASVSKTQTYIGGTKFSGTSGLITHTGEVTVKGEATDSRGYVGKAEKVITVIPYSKPAIAPASGETAIVCARCDASGNYSTSGTYLRIKAKRIYSPVIASGVQKNGCIIRYKVGSGSWKTILTKDASSDEVDTVISGVVSSVTSSYTIQVGVADDIGNTASATIIIPTESVTFSLRNGGQGAAFGEYSKDEKNLTVAADWELHAKGTSMFAMEWLGFDSASGATTDTFQADLEAVFAGMERYCYKKVQFVDPLLNNQKHMGTLWKYTSNYGFLTADNYSGVKAIKTYYGGTWNAWEWENPPMEPDVEYRTTERHNGKEVYTKLVQFGALPNAAEKIVTCMPQNANMIEAVGYASGSTYNVLIPGYKSIESMGSTRSNGTLWISTTNDMSAYNAWITIKYTK